MDQKAAEPILPALSEIQPFEFKPSKAEVVSILRKLAKVSVFSRPILDSKRNIYIAETGRWTF